jgi:mannose-6-phosphate isomerase-like protein (cupin superfamily)
MSNSHLYRSLPLLAFSAFIASTLSTSAQRATPPAPLADRIGHTDPSKYNHSRSHESAGDMACMLLVPPTAMDVNLNFMHRCEIMPGGGVGHHFHNATEEMFIIFDGQAEFTIDGRTSVLKGTVGAPVRMGHSHAIYNPSDKPVEFMNINVAMTKGHYDAFNLSDARVGAPKDAIPTFMTMHLDRATLKPIQNYHGGLGTVQYRRALDTDVFLTNWSYVDHLLIPPGATDGLHRHIGVEEIYYVLNGSGTVQVGTQTATINKGDAVPVRFNEPHTFTPTGGDGLELMIVGIAAQKGNLDTEIGAPTRGGQ